MEEKNEDSVQDDLIIQQSSTYQKLNDKFQDLISDVLNVYDYILEIGPKLEDLDIQLQVDQRQQTEDEFLRKNPQVMIKNMNHIFGKIFQITNDTVEKLKTRTDQEYEAYDKVQKKLEKEILEGQKVESLLKIKLECFQIKTTNLKRMIQQQEEQLDKSKSQNQQLKKDIDIILKEKKSEQIELKTLREKIHSQMRKKEGNEFLLKRTSLIGKQGSQHNNMNNTGSKQDFDQSGSQTHFPKEVTNIGGANRNSILNQAGFSQNNSQIFQSQSIARLQQQQYDLQARNNSLQLQAEETQTQAHFFFPYTIKSDQFNSLRSSIQSKNMIDANKGDRKQQNLVFQANRQKQNQSQKYIYELNRLQIQLESKERENKKLLKISEELQLELKKIKETILEEDKKKWAIEINSEKNPNLLDYYKGQIEQRNKQIKQVQKSQRKFAIQEKKLIVKEKAFEQERSDYHGRVLKQSQRIDILMQIKNVQKEHIDLMVKLDDLERKGITVKQVELVVDYLNRKGVTVREFQNLIDDDLRGKLDNYKQLSKQREQLKLQQQQQQQQQQEEQYLD